MDEVILMPRLSDTMTEGVIAAWHKNVGDTVKKGDVLAEIETDKATMDLESYKDGKLLHIGAKVGDKVPVNSLLCIVGKEGTDVNGILASTQKNNNTPASESKQTEKELPENNKQQNVQQTNVEIVTTQAEHTDDNNTNRIKASPLARKIASEKGINLDKIEGSGDGGRITKKDVDSYQPQETDTKTKETKKVPLVSNKESFEDVPVSTMRKTIAKRLSESKFTAPHFYLTMSVNMDKAVESRTKMNTISEVKISFNDIVIKAVAIALKKHPAVNASWLGNFIRYNHHVHIGVAVAVEEGLLVPVIRFADAKSLSQIALEVKDYAQKAKTKKLQPSNWEGNTFTISNLGMFGIDEFTAIINPPDACILAVSAIQQIPVVKDGEIKVGNIMKLTLSCDHRVVDGAIGAAFLQTLKVLLEEPLSMLV